MKSNNTDGRANFAEAASQTKYLALAGARLRKTDAMKATAENNVACHR
jgi:hypothetical protein